MGNWKSLIHKPQDDKNYLVCWLKEDATYSSPHRAYYMEEDNRFFSLENSNSHPIVADIYMDMPDANEEKEAIK